MKINFKVIQICISMKYATLFTLNRKVYIYFVAKVNRFKIKRRDMQYKTRSRSTYNMYGRIK